MARLYISQKRMDTWSTENRVAITGDLMTLVEPQRSFTIRPAVRFLRVTGTDDDPHDLVGRVKDEHELAKMGADHMANSVICGETAYDVEMGFVGNPVPRPKPAGAAPPAPPSVASRPGKD